MMNKQLKSARNKEYQLAKGIFLPTVGTILNIYHKDSLTIVSDDIRPYRQSRR
jgi:hypothetical protein